MLRAELLEILANLENSGIEFKRDGIRPEEFTIEVVALANLAGGKILLGVEDDGAISGLVRPDAQEWVFNVFRDKVHPQITPFYEEMRVDDKRIAIISFPQGISKPYVLRHSGREEIYVRRGNRSERATREEQARLYATGGLLHTETLPVAGTAIESLDMARLENYLSDMIRDPDVPETREQWLERLEGLGILTEQAGREPVCTVAGLVLFGLSPRRYLPQAGIRLMAFSGPDKEYKAQLDEVLDASLVSRFRVNTASGERKTIDKGLIDQFAERILPYIREENDLTEGNFQRSPSWQYPFEAVRETVINALVHRDWTRSVDIEVSLYSDRLEVISPGSLPNSMTVDKMKAGQRSPRNPLLAGILRDYGYVDARGMGVRIKVIPLMLQNTGVEPAFDDSEDSFKTTLPKKFHP